MIFILIGAGSLLGRVISIGSDGPILLPSVYKIAQAKNWQIQKIEISNFLGDYYDTIHFHLSDGSTKNCLYDHFFAEEYGFTHMFDFENMSDAQDVILCSDYMQPNN
jgi:hypothetical protein